MYNLKKLYDMVDNSNIVSFDIYDTLLKRTVTSPYDIFELTKLFYEKKYGELKLDFKNIRKNCESWARKNSKHEEITIDDIYKEIFLKYKIQKEVLEKLKSIECELEIDFIEKNEEIIDIYNYARKKNKKIIITSDMYLPKKTIELILRKKNIVYDKLFLSSELKMTKANGSIFNCILNYLKCNPNELLHIGDNKNSDYINPKIQNISSYWYNNHQNIKFTKTNYNEILNIVDKGIIQNLIKSNYWYDFGVNNVGILYYSFIKNLIENIKANNIDKVLFLARDGQILKNVYDFIATKEVIPESHYFFASRRCLNIPSIYDLSEEDINILLSNIDGKDIEYLFKKIGLDYNCYLDIMESYKIKTININIHKEQLYNLLTDLKHNILLNSKKEREILLAYLKKHNLDNKNIAIVDIGWNGTLQNSLNKICEKEGMNVKFFGYYLGITEQTKYYKSTNNTYNGFLFEDRLNVNFKYVSSFNAMFEEFFIANHGSIIKLKKKNEDIIPVCDDFEYSNQEYINLKLIQDGGVDYCKQMYALDKKYGFLETSPDNAIFKIAKVFTSPSFKDIENLGSIKHYDYDVKFNCKPNYNLIKYAVKPKLFIKEYKDAKWKIGFIKTTFRSNTILRLFKQIKGL